MFNSCPGLRPALLALALVLSAAAGARAQGESARQSDGAGGLTTQAEQTETAQTEAAQTGQQQGTPSGGGQQQPQPSPTPLTPLTGGQKVRRSLRAAFLSPVPYAVSAFNAGITQIGEDRLPHKDTGDELADWGSRTARVFATRTTYTFFGNGVYPALFKQDPRYERSRHKGLGRRALHAASRVFVTRDDDGNLEPNYSRFAGSLTANALANIWERSTPGRDRVGADATMRRFARSFATGALTNIIFREFGPDIFRIFRR